MVVAGATGGAGTLACVFFCANGVAADLPALLGALTPVLLAASDALLSAAVSRLLALSGTLATGLAPTGLSEVVPLMLKFYRRAEPHACPGSAPAPH